MKIAFITSCLESGKDGVGDYTRLLAQECVRQGHDCCLISLNDRFLSQSFQTEISVESKKILILRLPKNIPWQKRICRAEELLAIFQPDWVSLQFVSYGFNRKGVVCGLDKWLKNLLNDKKIHIMFHELWIGEQIGANFKDRFIGTVQKFFILKLIERLQPLLIHTNTSAYVAILKQHGISASRLPLFGSVPVTDQRGDSWLFQELQKMGLTINKDNRNQFWLLGFFGTLHPIWPAEPLFTYLFQASIKHGRKIIIISIGRLSSGERLWDTLSKTYASQFIFLQLGEQSPEKISQLFNSINFGIATSPYLLIEKSASVVAMLEHGLPVIVNRNDFQLESIKTSFQKTDPLLYVMGPDLSEMITKFNNRGLTQSRLPKVADQFINGLLGKSKEQLSVKGTGLP